MKNFIAIVKSTVGKLDKYQDFDTEAEAEVHVAEFGGFVASNPGGQMEYWIIDPVAKTVVNDQAQADADANLNSWENQMAAANAKMPGWFEDYIDENSIVLKPGRTKDNFDAKKTLWGQKP